jgi:BirA family biotin operon repressor/biotin-[acetyl-CoA-carboxylase] ligase
MLYPTTSLQEIGIRITAEEFMTIYLQNLAQNLERLNQGKNAALRQEWLSCAKGIGEEIVVCQEQNEQYGIFRGIDENAHLILEKENEICHIRVGDVFYIEKEV